MAELVHHWLKKINRQGPQELCYVGNERKGLKLFLGAACIPCFRVVLTMNHDSRILTQSRHLKLILLFYLNIFQVNKKELLTYHIYIT
jgi:hypothetical protein